MAILAAHREMTPEIQAELNMVTSGDAPRAEYGKLGQALTADLIWAGHIDNLAYIRHARKLTTSDRDLVSFDGGWAVSQKLVNVATRQLFVADALRGQAPEIAPTTMGPAINAGEVLQNMENDITSAIVASILTRTFPVTVVQRDGNVVVLSQGGDSVKQGGRYAMVVMGSELKDPQTGESLGRMESPCCDVVIDRVTPKLSYGHLENVKVPVEGISTGGMQMREAKSGPAPVIAEEVPAPEAATSPSASNQGSKLKMKRTTPTAEESTPADSKPDPM